MKLLNGVFEAQVIQLVSILLIPMISGNAGTHSQFYIATDQQGRSSYKLGSWGIFRKPSSKATLSSAGLWRPTLGLTYCTVRVFYLLFAAVDLPFLLCRQGEHGFPVFFCEVELILWSGTKIGIMLKRCWWGGPEGIENIFNCLVFTALYWLHAEGNDQW